MRSRTSPAAPARRPLLTSRDHGNAAPASPAAARGRTGKRETRSLSPLDGLGIDAESRAETMHAVDDRPAAPTAELPIPARALPVASSPLKRTESVVNLDRASMGSPVAKRRSLHAGVFGSDFNIFEQSMAAAGAAAAAEPVAEQREGSAATAAAAVVTSSVHPGSDHPPSPAAPLPRRASSLRRSTLQQRHQERPTYALAKPNPDLALERAAHATAFQSKPKPHRMSLDNFLPPMPRDSPFAAAATPLPSASAHLMPGVTGAGVAGPARPGASQPHPLSQAISQSSSSSSVAEDSPTHAPGRPDPLSHQVHDFARSLPLGALRPTRRAPSRPETTGQGASADLAYATPPNYRLIKPLPAAFMSTGLISKRNRDPTRPVAGVGQRAVMPDTPCKKPTFSFQAGPLPPANRRATTNNVIVPPAPHDFGSPSTPLPVYRPRLRAGTGVGIFGAKLNPQRLSRSGSFMSSDGDDQPHSPIDSQPGDYELPPTPTKPGLSPRMTPRSQGAVDVATFGTNDDAGDSDASSLGFGPGPGRGSSREIRPCKRPPCCRPRSPTPASPSTYSSVWLTWPLSTRFRAKAAVWPREPSHAPGERAAARPQRPLHIRTRQRTDGPARRQAAKQQ